MPNSHLYRNGYRHPDEGGRGDSNADPNHDAYSDANSHTNGNSNGLSNPNAKRHTVTRGIRDTDTDERPHPNTYGDDDSHQNRYRHAIKHTDMRILRSRNRDQYFLL